MADDNLSDVMAWVNGYTDSFNFLMPGEDQDLGRGLVGVVAQAIADSIAAGDSPDGTPLKPNAPKYAARKAKRYGVGEHAPLIRTGQLASLQSLIGDPEISADLIVMRYGTGEPPSRTATGAPLSASDEALTDVEKGYLVSEDRPYYFMTESIADDCIDYTYVAVARRLGEA